MDNQQTNDSFVLINTPDQKTPSPHKYSSNSSSNNSQTFSKSMFVGASPSHKTFSELATSPPEQSNETVLYRKYENWIENAWAQKPNENMREIANKHFYAFTENLDKWKQMEPEMYDLWENHVKNRLAENETP